MCGIFGAVGRAAWVTHLRVDPAVASMSHRGPDGEGLWPSSARGACGDVDDPACILGHRRLSIIDLSEAGRQPMVSGDGRYALVYNGEVYNFREIRRELESFGETFSSAGDSEVVLKACVRWGEGAIERFRGMFALGLWDERERTLLLARDRLGVKPLYVVSGPEGLAFASEVRALLEAGAARRLLSLRGLLGYMRFGSVQEPDTLVEGIRSVTPGTLLVYDGLEARERTYWSLASGRPTQVPRAEAVATIRNLLHESVRLRLVSDVPFGVFLSGGGDSSALAALASAESGRPVQTFTVVFDEKAFSEERWAREIALRFGCDHRSVRVTGHEAAADLTEAFRGQDQPSGDGLNTWLVSRAARRTGLAMALSGLGGDEVFAGYPSFRWFARLVRASRAAAMVPDKCHATVERWAARPGFPNRFRKGAAIARAAGRPGLVYAALRTLFTDSQVEALLPESAIQGIARDAGPSPEAESSGDFVMDLSRFELAGYLRNTLLRDADSMSMASSLEVRVPFLDHRLVEYVLSLPGGMKLDGAGNKPLLFEAVPELPTSVGLRRKMGFVLPLGDWFRGPMSQTIEGHLLGRPGQSPKVLQRQATEDTWKSFLSGDEGVSASRIVALASLSAWLAEHQLEMPW